MGSMESNKLERSCAGLEGVRDRAARFLGDSAEGATLRGDELALLLSGSFNDEAWLPLVADGEATRGGRGGSDLVEPRAVAGVRVFGKMLGVERDAGLCAVRAMDADDVLVGDLVDAPFSVLGGGCVLGEMVSAIG